MTATLEPPADPVSPPTPPPAAKRRRAPRPRRTPSPAGPPTRLDNAAAVVSSAFLMIGIVCLWVAVQLLFLSPLSQQRAQDLLYSQFRTQLAGATAPVGPTVTAGDPVALLRIPRLDLEQVVVEGTASGDLLAGPGHRRDTVLPGQAGSSVVYGRATTYGGPFGDLPDLRTGDEIDVVVGQGEQTFRVTGVRRAGDPLPQPLRAGAARLTLVTAEGSGRLSALAPDAVVYVDAEAPKGFAAPAGRTPAVPQSEQSMARDSSALPLLGLCLALLVAVTLGVVAARQRWSTVLVWVIASPIALALSWATTDVVMRLLPNLI